MEYKVIDEKKFRPIVEKFLMTAVSDDYVRDILDRKVSCRGTVFDLIKEDVERASAWREEGYYNEDDIRLAIGRVLLDRLVLFFP